MIRLRSARPYGNAFLDGGLAAAFGLHLQEAGGAVEVGPGADLVPPTPAPGRQQVAVPFGGIEVHGVVLEGPQSVHLENADAGVKRGQKLPGPQDGDDVLAVHPGLQCRRGVQLLQPHGRQVPEAR